jgi:hypothetical protein
MGATAGNPVPITYDTDVDGDRKNLVGNGFPVAPGIAFGDSFVDGACTINQKWGKYYPQDQSQKKVKLVFADVSSVEVVFSAVSAVTEDPTGQVCGLVPSLNCTEPGGG